MRTARAGEQVIDTVDDFIDALRLRAKEATESESIKLLWAAVDFLEPYGLTYTLTINAVTDDAQIVLNVGKVPALQHRTVYYLNEEAATK